MRYPRRRIARIDDFAPVDREPAQGLAATRAAAAMPVSTVYPPPRSPWRGLRRVLAVRLDILGDMLMTTPALSAARDSLPGVEFLTLLTSPSGASAAPHVWLVDEVWACEVPWMGGVRSTAVRAVRDDERGRNDRPAARSDDGFAEAASALGRAEAELIERLAGGRFDAALIFTVCTQSALPAALLCRMAGIPLRAAHSRENPVGLLIDWVQDPDQVVGTSAIERQPELVRHEVLRQLALCAAVGLHTTDNSLRFSVLEPDRQRIAAQLHAAGIPRGTPCALLHPGATAASRRWPAGHFGAAARQLLENGTAVVVSGDASERALADEVLQASAWPSPGGHVNAGGPCLVGLVDSEGITHTGPVAVSMAGRHSLGELAALIEGASVVVANNSAAAHLTAAVGTPVVDLNALTNPQHTPWPVAWPGAQPRRHLPLVPEEHLPARAPRLLAPCRAGSRRPCRHRPGPTAGRAWPRAPFRPRQTFTAAGRWRRAGGRCSTPISAPSGVTRRSSRGCSGPGWATKRCLTTPRWPSARRRCWPTTGSSAGIRGGWNGARVPRSALDPGQPDQPEDAAALRRLEGSRGLPSGGARGAGRSLGRLVDAGAGQRRQFAVHAVHAPGATAAGRPHVQTVHGETNPRFHSLLRAFGQRMGVPVLVDTSFNVRRQPVVCAPRDALEAFFTTPLDALVMGRQVLLKPRIR